MHLSHKSFLLWTVSLVNVFNYRLCDGVSVPSVEAGFGQIHYVTEIATGLLFILYMYKILGYVNFRM